jgi:hypothetical protein
MGSQAPTPHQWELEFYSRILYSQAVNNDLLLQLMIVIIIIASLLAALLVLTAVKK